MTACGWDGKWTLSLGLDGQVVSAGALGCGLVLGWRRLGASPAQFLLYLLSLSVQGRTMFRGMIYY